MLWIQEAVVDYVIKTSTGLSISVPAENWIEAFGRALSILGRDASSIVMLAVHRVDGRHYVEDSNGDGYMVHETPVISVVANPPRTTNTPAPVSRRSTTWVPPDTAPPPLDIPRPSGLAAAGVPARNRPS